MARPRSEKQTAPRPISVEEPVASEMSCEECCRQQKIDTALSVISMFLEATKPNFIQVADGTTFEIAQRDLKPKENATYMSALDWVERYLDAQDSATDARPPGAGWPNCQCP